MDLALALVEEDLGSRVALAVARDLFVFLKRPGGQAQFSRSLAAQSSTRKSLQELLVWIVENLDQDLTVENLASRAAMSRRNFTRVFANQLGRSPAKYVEQPLVSAQRAWSNICAPRRVQRMCCFFSIRQSTSWSTVDSTRAVDMRWPLRYSLPQRWSLIRMWNPRLSARFKQPILGA